MLWLLWLWFKFCHHIINMSLKNNRGFPTIVMGLPWQFVVILHENFHGISTPISPSSYGDPLMETLQRRRYTKPSNGDSPWKFSHGNFPMETPPEAGAAEPRPGPSSEGCGSHAADLSKASVQIVEKETTWNNNLSNFINNNGGNNSSKMGWTLNSGVISRQRWRSTVFNNANSVTVFT